MGVHSFLFVNFAGLCIYDKDHQKKFKMIKKTNFGKAVRDLTQGQVFTTIFFVYSRPESTTVR